MGFHSRIGGYGTDIFVTAINIGGVNVNSNKNNQNVTRWTYFVQIIKKQLFNTSPHLKKVLMCQTV